MKNRQPEPRSRWAVPVPAARSIKTEEFLKFGRYLVREFFWELEQHEPVPSSFAGVQQDWVEVLWFRGYDDMRIRIPDGVFDVHLSWRKDVPPEIQKVEER